MKSTIVSGCLAIFLINVFYTTCLGSSNLGQEDKTRELYLKFDSLRYDSIQVSIYSWRERVPIKKYATLINEREYFIEIPDSIYENYTDLRIFGKKVDKDTVFSKELAWNIFAKKNDSIPIGPVNMFLYFNDEKKIFLDLQYFEPREFTDTYTILNHCYTEDNDEIYLTFSTFQTIWAKEWNSHEEELEYLRGEIRKHPDSQALLRLAAVLELRSTAKVSSLKEMYALFSERNKESFYGKIFSEYIQTREEIKFNNIQLEENDTGGLEYILRDTTTYNLVVFSASWCRPCIEEIPLLKKIHADLKGKLEITYISLDEEQMVKNWKKLLKEEQIPWRSLLAYKDTNYIIRIFLIEGIPLSYLVYPDGHFEEFEVRIENELQKLYGLVNAEK
jgi:thiol-disulfide isomerase/thioredoxin